MTRTLAAAVALLLLITPALTQTPPISTVPPNGTIRSSTSLVLVPTLVQSLSATDLPALDARDFRLTDNGIPQQVSAEHIPNQPVAIVVLLQTGASAPRQFPNYTGLSTMLDNLVGNAPHKLALVTFDSQPEVLWDFTTDPADLAKALQHPAPGDGGAAITDAVNFGIDLLDEQPASYRRVLLLLSQPYDDGSHTRPNDVVERLGKSNTTIEALTFSPEKTWLKDQFTKPRHGNKPYKFGPDYPLIDHTFDLGTPLGVALKSMREDTAAEVASLSGGQRLPFSDKRTLEQQLLLLTNQIPSLYTLSFHPTVNTPGFHQLRVSLVNHSEPLKASARTSYWSSSESPGEPSPPAP